MRNEPGPQSALRAYCLCFLVLTGIAWGLAVTDRILLHWDFPWDWPLLYIAPSFSDLTGYTSMIRRLPIDGSTAIAKGQMYNYPAPALYVYWFFLHVFHQPVTAFLVFAGAVWISALELLRRSLPAGRWTYAALALTGICGYPFLFVVDRANIEIVVFAFVTGGLFFFARNRYGVAAVLFAVAGSIKPFPLLLFYLLLTRKRWREILVGLSVTGMLNLTALWWLGPNIPEALSALKPGAAAFYNGYVLNYRDAEIQFDHSLFALIKQLVRLSMDWADPEDLLIPIRIAYWFYLPVAAITTLLCGWTFRHKPFLNQFFALILVIITLSPVSYDYTLIYVYVLWGLYLIYILGDRPARKPLHFLLPMAVLLTPQSYLQTLTIGFGGQCKTAMLVYLLVMAARIEMPMRLFGDLPINPRQRTLE